MLVGKGWAIVRAPDWTYVRARHLILRTIHFLYLLVPLEERLVFT